MRKHVAVVVLVMLVLAGSSSSAVIDGALAQPKPLAAMRQAHRLGPKPTPRWYWHWQAWRLGEGYAKGHRRERDLRPERAPDPVPRWAWRRLHFFLLARTPAGAGTGTTKTGNPSAVASYRHAISYTQERPAFMPVREIDVSSAAGFKNALASLQPGDLVKATAPFTVYGTTRITSQLSSWAVLDLGDDVTFDYNGGKNDAAVYLHNPSYIRIYGGMVTTDDSGGGCIVSHGMTHILWWGFYVHDCGGTGLGMMGANDGGPTANNDFQGEITKAGENDSWDPHTEKGSGQHGANLDDGGYFPFEYNRIALDIHDQPSGAGIEYGASSGFPPQHNTIIERAVNLTFASTVQTGGNAIQFWGIDGQSADIKYLEVSNAQGYGLFAGGMYSGTTLSGVTLEHGRASNTNLNPRYAGQGPWQPTHGVIYQGVQPAPRAG
jgi:hypothetical protein